MGQSLRREQRLFGDIDEIIPLFMLSLRPYKVLIPLHLLLRLPFTFLLPDTDNPVFVFISSKLDICGAQTAEFLYVKI
jgi:hypothetical protein